MDIQETAAASQSTPNTNQKMTSETTLGSTSPKNLSDTLSDKTKTHKMRRQLFSEKVFQTRESYLTDLLQNEHMKTIYNIFYVILLLFFMHNIIYEYFVDGSITFGLGNFKKGFNRLHYVLGFWLLQFIFMISTFYSLKLWSVIRCKLANKKTLQHLWSLNCLTLYIASLVIFAYIPAQLCLKFKFTYISGSVLLIETLRMIMKMHSFVRTVAARVVRGKEKSDNDEEKSKFTNDIPSISKYVYFLFAPTLLYRDNYPRTSVIRWKFAMTRLMEIVLGAFLYSYIYENHIKYHFGNFGKEDITAASIVLKLYGMLLPCILVFLCLFYMVLHSWLNFCAEILRFGDRLFYRDWWTAGNYGTYYRTWNIVVHEWLYEYIYKDVYTYILKESKLGSSLAVFLISALFHEYMIGYALQLFFPVMFIFFGVVGVSMVFITRLVPKNLGNIIIWFSLVSGNGLMISLYCMEYFASINCPKVAYDTWSDILVPHIWSCYNK